MAMAKPEIPCEVVPCRVRKRDSNDDSIYKESDDSYDSEDSIINVSDNDSVESEYESVSSDDPDDPRYEILEGKADINVWKQYLREWRESEGFDFSVHPGTSFMAGLVSINHELKDPEFKQVYTDMCKSAINDFNTKNDTMHAFEEIVNVNRQYGGGEMLYFTFKATDTTADVADAIKTFQAKWWHESDRNVKVLHFCRLKKPLSNEALLISDEMKTKKKKKKSSLVKSFVPGLVIEELSKGKPRGKKAYISYEVAVRYTGKLKDNGKIFDTNIGEGDPLVFRIARGDVVRGLEEGVIGMRVGDKRRITIPPDSGYGAKGHEGHHGVVPRDSWLVIEVELVDVIWNDAES